jgi:hypothetical protein
MALVGDFKVIVTNQTAGAIALEDISGVVTDPVAAGVPTVPAGVGTGVLELILTPSVLISWEKGRLKAEIDAVHVVVTSTGGGGGGGATPVLLQNVGKMTTVDFTQGTVVNGQFAFDWSDYSTDYTAAKFQAVGSVTPPETGTVQLYNLTDGAPVATLGTFTSATPTKLVSADISGSLPASEKVYEIRISVTGSTAADTITVGSAVLRLEP